MQHRYRFHYSDVIMSAIASPITGVSIVHWIVCSGADERRHQSSASLAFVWGIHRGPVNSPHKWPVTRKMFPFDNVIMWRGSLLTIIMLQMSVSWDRKLSSFAVNEVRVWLPNYRNFCLNDTVDRNFVGNQETSGRQLESPRRHNKVLLFKFAVRSHLQNCL